MSDFILKDLIEVVTELEKHNAPHDPVGTFHMRVARDSLLREPSAQLELTHGELAVLGSIINHWAGEHLDDPHTDEALEILRRLVLVRMTLFDERTRRIL